MLPLGGGDGLFPEGMPPPSEVAFLRLHEHDEVGFRVGDASWVTFSIPAADLAALRFEAARASCCIG